MKLKNLVLAFFTILTVGFCLTSCSSSPVASENKIKTDLETSNGFLAANEKIDQVVINKRQTISSQKKDTVWCTIDTDDTLIAYQRPVILTYDLYDKDGWILDNVVPDPSSQGVETPLKGVDTTSLASSLTGVNVNLNNEEWYITPDIIGNISVDKQDTNLDQKIDKITATVSLDSDVETAQGQLVLNYKFDNGWKLDSLTGNNDFTATYKPNAELKVSNDDLIAILIQKDIPFSNGATQQTISMSTDEITNFTIENDTSSQKGTVQTYDCSFLITKPNVTFNTKAQIIYTYNKIGGWSVNNITATPTVNSVNLVGDWTGESPSGPCKLIINIQKVAADGSITAIFNFSALPINPDEPSGSFKMNGGIDLNTLQIVLKAGEWIEQPDNWGTSDMNGCLYVDDSEIKSIDGYPFDIKQ